MTAVRDVVAIFIAEFQAQRGNIIDWSLVADESVSLDSVEFSSLPSGIHGVEKDVIYLTTGVYQGCCVYRRIPSDEEGTRGARMISIGVLVAQSTRPRPWNHINALKRFAVRLEDDLKERECLKEYFEERKVLNLDLPEEETWNGWEAELSRATMDHPAFHLSHVLHVLGISSLTLFKHALGRRRILIYTHPPVESACLLAQLAAVISTGEEGIIGVHERRITVLGLVGLTDLARIEQETARGNGWIACTTDAIFLEKPKTYDLLIDLMNPAQLRPHRPSLSLSRAVEGSGPPSYKLQSVRFTWSDFKLWTELETILESDPDHSHPFEAPGSAKARWSDPWSVYDDICMVCAGIWAGWKPTPSIKLEDSPRQRPSRSSSQSTGITANTSQSGTQMRPSADMKKSRRSSVDPRLGTLSSTPTTNHTVTTLSLLSAFHNHTAFLLSRLAQVAPSNADASSLSSNPIIIGPREMVAFDLGPGSDLDARFVEWLGETRGQRLKVKRGWKDIISFFLGFP